jgi:hypothetical protein
MQTKRATTTSSPHTVHPRKMNPLLRTQGGPTKRPKMENQSLSPHVNSSISHFTPFPTTPVICEYTDFFAAWWEDGTDTAIRIIIPNPDPSSLIIYYVGVKSFPDVTSSYHTLFEGNL